MDRNTLAAKHRCDAGKIITLVPDGHIARDLRLSPRELDIARRLLDDEKEYAISDQLGISRHTVHMHVERLYRKLEVQSHTKLVLCVVESFLRLTTDPRANLPSICSRRAGGLCPLGD